MNKRWKTTWQWIGLLGCSLVLLIAFSWGVTAEETAVSQEGQWTTKLTAPLGQRQKISMSSGDAGWFVQFSASNTAYLAQYNGTNWSPSGTAGHSQLIIAADIEMLSATDGWLVLGGEIGATNAKSSIYRWNGTSWNFVTELTDANGVSLSSLAVFSANDAWALGGGKFWANLYHWDGANWTFAGKTPGGVWAGHDLAMLSGTDGWAVGSSGAITHWNGAEWTTVPSATSATLNAIDMVDSNTGWAVGDDGTIQAWGGTAWATYLSPTSADLYSIDMVSANEGWIVGDNVILHWDGNQWSTYTSPVADTFHDVDMVSAKDGWLIGNGHLLQYDVVEPELLMQYTTGAPGSYFTVAGQNFPPNETATISVNGRIMGTTAVNGDGRFLFILTTANADEGTYFVTASVNPTVTKQFILSATEPVRPQEESGDTFDVPVGIAFNDFIYLPAILR